MEQIQRLLVRVSLCEEDNKLQEVLDTSLTVAVAGLGDPLLQPTALQIVSHVLKRVKATQSLVPPLAKLVDLIATTTTSPVVVNVVMIFLDLAFRRSSLTDRVAVAWKLLKGVASRPAESQGDVLLHMFLSIIEHFEANKSVWPPDFEKVDRDALLSFLFDVMTCTHPKQTHGQWIGPGSSMASTRRVTGKEGAEKLTVAELLSRKEAIARFVTWAHREGVFEEQDLFVLMLVAACDGGTSGPFVSNEGESMLKRVAVGKRLNLEDPSLISKLFSMALGTTTNPSSPAIPQDTFRLPVAPQLRVLTITYLSQSVLAANKFPEALQLISHCLHGNMVTPRVRQAGMGFVQWVFRHASDNLMRVVGPVMLSLVYKLLEQVAEATDRESCDLKSFAFSSIGLVAKRAPQLTGKDIKLLALLLKSLDFERGNAKIAAQDALMTVAYTLANPQPDVGALVQSLLLAKMQENKPDLSFALVSCCIRIFPFNNLFARYLCMAAAASDRPEARDEAARGLLPYALKDNEIIPSSTTPYPSFTEMVDTIAGYLGDTLPGNQHADHHSSLRLSYKDTLTFLHHCLEQVTNLPSFLSSLPHQTAAAYTCLIGEALHKANKPSDDLIHLALGYLHEVAWFAPQLIDSSLRDKVMDLLDVAAWDSRDLCAKIIALVSSSSSLVEKLCGSLTTFSSSPAVANQSGSLEALGYTLGRMLSAVPPMEVAKTTVERVQSLLLEIVSAHQLPSHFFVAACKALASVYQTITLTDLSVIKQLARLLQSEERTVVEASAAALGDIFIGLRSSSVLPETFVSAAVDALFSTSESKSHEVLLTVGESLTLVAVGKKSTALANPLIPKIALQTPPSCETPAFDDEPMRAILQRVFGLFSQSQLKRSSGCVWLLAMCKHCPGHQLMRRNSQGIQEIFLSLLADNNDLTQDAAARGLVLLHELGDECTKQLLVQSLFSSISSPATGSKQPTTTAAIKIANPDDVIFPPGALGEMPKEVGQLSTYKELCSLANEVGRPDLIMKFMNLAAASSKLNSARGSAYAMTEIAAKSKEQLRPLLPQLVPVLYRQSFDPNPRVQAAMSSVLSAISGGGSNGSRKAVTEHFDAVIETIIKGLQADQWRIRESSASAVVDVISCAPTTERLLPHVLPLFTLCMRVADDIKETSRKAGATAMVALSKLIVRLCDISQTPVELSKSAIQSLLPLLLSNLENRVETIATLSATLVKKICRNGGSALVPQIPEVVETVVQLLSSVESTSLSYIALHIAAAEKDKETLHTLNALRDMAVKKHPLNEALEACIAQTCGATVMTDVCSRLASLAHKAVGLPSRTAVARCIVGLCTGDHAADITPSAAALLAKSVLPTALFDESRPVRTAHAQALAQVVSLAGVQVAKQVITKIVSTYLSDESSTGDSAGSTSSDSKHEACACAVRELIKTVKHDLLVELLGDLVPLVVIGQREHTNNRIAKQAFDTTFAELPIAGLHLYAGGIIQMSSGLLESPSWALKRQGAATLAHVVKSVDLTEDRCMEIAKTLVSALSGRTWAGKEELLDALAAVTTVVIEKNQKHDLPSTVLPLLLKELVNRKVMLYKQHAASALVDILTDYIKANTTDMLWGEWNASVTTMLADLHQQIISSSTTTPSPSSSLSGGSTVVTTAESVGSFNTVDSVKERKAQELEESKKEHEALGFVVSHSLTLLVQLFIGCKVAVMDPGVFGGVLSCVCQAIPHVGMVVQISGLKALIELFTKALPKLSKEAVVAITVGGQLFDTLKISLMSKHEAVRLLALDVFLTISEIPSQSSGDGVGLVLLSRMCSQTDLASGLVPLLDSALALTPNDPQKLSALNRAKANLLHQ